MRAARYFFALGIYQAEKRRASQATWTPNARHLAARGAEIRRIASFF